jgi:hypothetical protein
VGGKLPHRLQGAFCIGFLQKLLYHTRARLDFQDKPRYAIDIEMKGVIAMCDFIARARGSCGAVQRSL